MNLTPEQQELGRRNFMKALAGLPALAALGGAVALKGPLKGGPVRLGFLGLGSQGRVLLEQADKDFSEVVALCDINPAQLQKADAALQKRGRPPAKHYSDWKEMVEKEHLEGVVMAPPLWKHAELASGVLETGKHVLCEKMMAWDEAGCQQMLAASRKADRLLEIGYQRNYNPMYQAAYDGIIKPGALGEIFHVRLVWHRNGDWRRKGDPPSPDFDPSKWGYPTWDHLLNWRLWWRYSKGLLAELASHQLNVANWFLGSTPEAVMGSGGVYLYKEGGREADDHVYAIFEYPGGRTAVFTAIESNAYDHYYEMFMGTKGTLILRGETEAYLFDEGQGPKATTLAVTPKAGGPALEASESRNADAAGTSVAGSSNNMVDRVSASRLEVSGFCSSIRTGQPLRCGPERAMKSAYACIAAHEAIQKKTRVVVSKT